MILTDTRVRNQLIATVIGNFLVFGQGTHAGWYSPTLPLLRSVDTPLLDGPLSTDMAGWIGSAVAIGSLIGVLMFGSMAMWSGFRRALLLATVPIVAAWLLVVFGTYSWHLLMSRLLSGLTVGAVYVCMPQYVAEMSSDQ